MEEGEIRAVIESLSNKIDDLRKSMEDRLSNIDKKLRDLDYSIQNDGSRLARAKDIVRRCLNTKE